MDITSSQDGGVDAFTPTPRPCWIAGRPESSEGRQAIRHPYDETEVATVCVPDSDQVWRAVRGAAAARHEVAACSRRSVSTALTSLAHGLADRAEEFAEIITAENGKPLRWAEIEVDRAASVFRLAASSVDADAGEPDRWADVSTRRVPRGPVLALTSADYPLYTAARQAAAALAVGAPVLIKPSPRTPLSALMLGELLAEADLAEGTFSVLPLDDEAAQALAGDERAAVVSLTGSRHTAAVLRRVVADRHLVLELGGVTTALVCADWSTPEELDLAARRIAEFGNHQAGQSAEAVQRVVVDESVAADFLPRLTAAVGALRTGDPHDPDVQVGPLIDEAASARVGDWITEAVGTGAEVLIGGRRSGTSVEPTVLVGAAPTARLWREEAFGPVLVVSRAAGLAAALSQVEDALPGGRAAIFTHDRRAVRQAGTALGADELTVGDVPAVEARRERDGDADAPDRSALRRLMHEFTVERRTIFADDPR
ncbi:acyl-CoA reductase-like NAD-dependent aldehyde dehydrogenase [Actinoalloteichus hoggarensis]|uniref:Succinate-semialdehyde dehydrogenase [NADP(+)] n=1 Tax=Actinoalloteichus hoggarensis TaxID=1470176 RepID=A0A221WAX5_9PSEU|nr:aldehyde dehydrogenase family protein [Actinoalloteichus hoggarensis]ASO22736.1 Succinate-semialdehyde dehydrogenase [NADP(+)] [Actinoalloteichus hoggarensis]MBB5924122.1 acyl-CoA reductase-like NAD-dependent aldehyde dehydrogenase [Actinoalloteichus hoggarensis]